MSARAHVKGKIPRAVRPCHGIELKSKALRTARWPALREPTVRTLSPGPEGPGCQGKRPHGLKVKSKGQKRTRHAVSLQYGLPGVLNDYRVRRFKARRAAPAHLFSCSNVTSRSFTTLAKVRVAVQDDILGHLPIMNGRAQQAAPLRKSNTRSKARQARQEISRAGRPCHEIRVSKIARP
jgi:hypothetical protein